MLAALGGVGAVGAGAFLLWDGEHSGIGPATAFVDNRQSEPLRLTVEVIPHSEREAVFSRQLDVPGGERRRFADVFPGSGRYHVSGSTPEGDSDVYDRVRVWREDGELTGMAGFVQIQEDGELSAGAFLPAGVGSPPDRRR